MYTELSNNTEITRTESMYRLIIHLIDTQDEEHQQQLFLKQEQSARSYECLKSIQTPRQVISPIVASQFVDLISMRKHFLNCLQHTVAYFACTSKVDPICYKQNTSYQSLNPIQRSSTQTFLYYLKEDWTGETASKAISS